MNISTYASRFYNKLFHLILSTVLGGLLLSPTLLKAQDCGDPILTNLSESICRGESFSVGNSNYSETGIYTDSLSNSEGCDSIVNLFLFVINPVFSQNSATICAGDTLFIGQNKYVTQGLYTDTLRTNLGCDSIVITNLRVIQPVVSNISRSFCSGKSFVFNGVTYTQAGNYSTRLQAFSGCDSIINLNLSERLNSSSNLTFNICEGDSVRIGNKIYTTAGIRIDTLTNSNNCDSIVTSNISIIPTIRVAQAFSFCFGDSVVVGNKVYKQSGTFLDTLESSLNCDSIITSTISVIQAIRVARTFSICDEDSVQVGSSIYKEAGVFVDTLNSSRNCDSIITSTINVILPIRVSRTFTICDGDSVRVGNSVYKQSGIFVDTLISSRNCDSIVTSNITVLQAIRVSEAFNLCEGDSIKIGNSIYKAAGTFVDTLSSSRNCDSIVTSTITVIPAIRTAQTFSICNGDSIKVGNSVYKQAGVFTNVFNSSLNCDSIVTTTLIVHPNFNRTDQVSICIGQTYTVGNNTYSSPGIYNDTLKTIFGCDSIIRTNLQFVENIIRTQTVRICDNESYSVGNSVYTTAGTYRDTLESSGGCDSIIITTLRINRTFNLNRTTIICEGDVLAFGDTLLSTAGIYRKVFKTINDCDSTINLTLVVQGASFTPISRTACVGENIVINAQTYTRDTTFSILLENILGCDSTVQYTLKFNPIFNLTQNRTICVPGNFENVPISKDTTITRSLKTIFGCDSIITFQIKAAFPSETELTENVCIGQLYEGVAISKDTILELKFSNIEGCDSLVNVFVTALPNPVITVTRDTIINPGSPLTLFASGASTYTWNSGEQSAVINVSPVITTAYTVTGTAENGCKGSATINVEVNACKIEVPTLFTPNGDGFHDKLVLKGIECLETFKIEVFNRWGNKVFESEDKNSLWDGTRDGKEVSEGVYYYFISGEGFSNSKVFIEKGFFHIKR